MAAAAAAQVYEAAGIGPGDVDVVELHDCFAQNELITYEALGLCPKARPSVHRDGDNTYGGASSPTRRAACSARATRWAPPAWRSARADQAAARHRPSSARWKAPAWRCSTTWAGRRLRRDAVREGPERMIDRQWIGHELPRHGGRGEGPAALLCQGHRPDRPRLHRRGRRTAAGYADAAGAAHLPVLPGDGRAPEPCCCATSWTSAAQAAARRAALHLPPPACAGDTLTLRQRIADIYDKKGGALEFVVRETSRAPTSTASMVAELRSVLVCRHGLRT
jgi:hypothetical protein